MTEIVLDLETNGLLEHPNLDKSKTRCTKIHVVGYKDIAEGGESQTVSHPTHADLTKIMSGVTKVIGHNILGFDAPVLSKIIRYDIPDDVLVIDTLVLSRLVFPDLWERDSILAAKGLIPRKLMNRHSLEAWGYRLNMHKGDYAEVCKEKGIDPWAEINPDMIEYCKGDVDLTVVLYRYLMARIESEACIHVEHGVASLCLTQERVGVGFDEEAAVSLYGDLANRKADIERELKETFGNWTVRLADFIPKRDNKRLGYTAGVPVPKYKDIEFNPSSREHLAKVLMEKYNWKPTTFTATGKPEVSEEILEGLKFPEAALMLEYLMLDKRVGMLSTGSQGWLRANVNGRIYGRINTNGAVSGRATHSSPNLAQVPKVGSPYGKECRALFRPRKGWVMVGADASGLELRCLAHYLAIYDGGAYAVVVTTGDVHTVNQHAAGIPTRNGAKTFIYALLYGAGDGKIGSIIGKSAKAGALMRKKFMDSIPAFAQLTNAVHKKVRATGKLKGLDGRILESRSPHSALNLLFQSAGAVIMKQAMINYVELLKQQDIILGRDYNQVLWIHDEFQVECKPDLAETIGKAMVDGIRKVTADFNFRCPLDGEFKIGNDWSETH